MRCRIIRRQAHLFFVRRFGLLRISAVEVSIAQSTECGRIIRIEANRQFVSIDGFRILLVFGELLGFVNQTGRFAYRLSLRRASMALRADR